MLNICMKMVNELYVLLTGLIGWVFVYELSFCRFDRFAELVPWPTECRFRLKCICDMIRTNS